MTRFFNRASDREKRQLLRAQRPPAERILWTYLRKRQLGYKFRRQFGIGNYVVDFYCPEKQLVIEIDGESHFTKDAIEDDQIREHYLRSLHLRIVRFKNQEVKGNVINVVERIQRTLHDI